MINSKTTNITLLVAFIYFFFAQNDVVVVGVIN